MNYQSWPERQDICTIDDARTNKFKFSFAPRTIRDWNNKPHNVVEIADDAKFRKLLLFTILQKSADSRCK